MRPLRETAFVPYGTTHHECWKIPYGSLFVRPRPCGIAGAHGMLEGHEMEMFRHSQSPVYDVLYTACTLYMLHLMPGMVLGMLAGTARTMGAANVRSMK